MEIVLLRKVDLCFHLRSIKRILGYYTIDILMGKSDASFTEYFFER